MIDTRNDAQDSYSQVLEQVRSLATGPNSGISLMANIASILYWSIPRVNWVGFYINQSNILMLGPFHGNPACVEIPFGSGVCGTAASRKETVVVHDVHEFPGHITCDTASRSEIVVPLVKGGQVIGVLDVDSPDYGRFGVEEKIFFEAVSAILIDACASDLTTRISS